MRTALANGALKGSAPPGAAMFTFPPDAPTDTPALLGLTGTRCVFFDDQGGHRCRVQDALGHDALPLACRQFPRVTVRDPRGVSLALSAYCPTVARLLDSTGPVTIVESPSAFPNSGEYEGLDARAQLPPLLRPDCLMDWESWWAFEASSVELLANSGGSVRDALASLRIAVEDARKWAAHDGPLITRVADAFARARHTKWVNGSVGRWVNKERSDVRITERCREVEEAIPADLRPGASMRSDQPADGVVRRYLASHAFANWTIHLGQGLQTWLRSIEAAHALVLSGLNVREADLRLRHLADPAELARVWAQAER